MVAIVIAKHKASIVDAVIVIIVVGVVILAKAAIAAAATSASASFVEYHLECSIDVECVA